VIGQKLVDRFNSNLRHRQIDELSSAELYTTPPVNEFTENIKCQRNSALSWIRKDAIETIIQKLLESTKNIDKIGKIFCEMHGRDHRIEFKNEFNFWDKKIKKYLKKKFSY
jgi:hypothetical protein